VFDRTRASLSRLGLLAEDYDPAEPRMWGNFRRRTLTLD